MRNRRWVAIAGLACAALCTWGVLAFLREAPDESPHDVDAAAKAAAARVGVTKHGDDATRDDASKPELTPTVVAVEPRLEWPDVAALRRIEQRGRLLFGGIVYAPDGSPCPGASVFYTGPNGWNDAAIATTDDHGAWRADVARPRGFDLDDEVLGVETKTTRRIAAMKENVGFAEADVGAESGRVDLHLHGGFAFRGTVVDNDDLRPVGGAELDARVVWFFARTHADARGDFAFPSLPAGNLELSGRAPGYDSNGSFSYDFDRGRDVTITFRLTRSYRLRGRFAPWPSPLVAAASATVVFRPRSPHGGSTAPTPSGAVAADGSFDVLMPVCPVGTVELVTPGGAVWDCDVDVNEEKHDVDLGTVELAPPATLTGRVEVPDGAPIGAIEVVAWVPSERGTFACMRRPIAADGAFRLAPLPAGWIRLTVEFDGNQVASLYGASGLSEQERSEARVALAAGETRDVGVIVPKETIVFGTVRDGRGEPVALAQIREVLDARNAPLHMRVQSFHLTWSDEDGRFRQDLGSYDVPPSNRTFAVHARGFAPQRIEIEFPARATWIRREVVLADGVTLQGTLVDAAGAKLAGWSIRVLASDAPDHDPEGRAAFDVTHADGSFEVRGLAAGEYVLFARPRGGETLKFAKIHPESGAITLCTRDGIAVPVSK